METDQIDLLYYLSSNIPGGNNPVHLERSNREKEGKRGVN